MREALGVAVRCVEVAEAGSQTAVSGRIDTSLMALRRGGLRWLVVDDDVAALEREAPGETVVVQVSRADHAPVRLPAGRFGRDWSGLAGTVDVAPIDGVVELPGDGPAVRMWRTR